MDTELNIFTKTKEKEFIPAFPCHSHFIESSSLLPFTCTTEWYENNNSARVPWTKLESANILFKGEDKVILALC